MSIDHYPSTYDCPVEEGGDPVLACKERARERLIKGHVTRSTYIRDSMCCAVGALALAEGHTKWRNEIPIEEWLSSTTLEAMAILDAVALERHPEAGDKEKWVDRWHGPLEWVNEQWEPGKSFMPIKDAVKAEVLAIYDIAIERRRTERDIPKAPETWPIIEHEPEHEPEVPAELLVTV